MKHILFAAAAALAAGPAVAADVKLHPVKAFTVEYQYEGSMSGTVTQYNDAHGHKRAEIHDTVTKVMGFSTKEKKRVVYEHDLIITIPESGPATKMENPMHDQLKQGLKDSNKSGEELGKEMMQAMGGVETGEKGNFAGEACNWWTVSSFGQKMCITKDAIPVRLEVDFMGMKFMQTATDVRRGDAGPASAYAWSESDVQTMPSLPGGMGEMPDMGDIQKMMEQFGGQN